MHTMCQGKNSLRNTAIINIVFIALSVAAFIVVVSDFEDFSYLLWAVIISFGLNLALAIGVIVAECRRAQRPPVPGYAPVPLAAAQMVNVVERSCEVKDCRTRPIYGFEGGPPQRCEKHKVGHDEP
jgi:hypothetical protein